MRGQRAERTEFTQTGSAQPTAMPVKHLQHPFLYIPQQPKKKRKEMARTRELGGLIL